MKPEIRLIYLMRYAQWGHKVCVIGKGTPCTHTHIGDGIIFFRNHCVPMLRSVRVDTVWFMEYPVPEKVEGLGIQMTCLSRNPRIIKGNE